MIGQEEWLHVGLGEVEVVYWEKFLLRMTRHWNGLHGGGGVTDPEDVPGMWRYGTEGWAGGLVGIELENLRGLFQSE